MIFDYFSIFCNILFLLCRRLFLIVAASAVLLFGGGSAQRRFGDGGPFGDDDDGTDGTTLTLKAALKQGFVDVTGVQTNVSKHIGPQF
jgi:hypothetical protein